MFILPREHENHSKGIEFNPTLVSLVTIWTKDALTWVGDVSRTEVLWRWMQCGTGKEKRVTICTHKFNDWYIIVTQLTLAIIICKLCASK